MKKHFLLILAFLILLAFSSCKNARLISSDISESPLSSDTIESDSIESEVESKMVYDYEFSFIPANPALINETADVLERRITAVAEQVDVYVFDGRIIVCCSDLLFQLDVPLFLSTKGEFNFCDSNGDTMFTNKNITSAENIYADFDGDDRAEYSLSFSFDDEAKTAFNTAVAELTAGETFFIYLDDELIGEPTADPKLVLTENELMLTLSDDKKEMDYCILASYMTAALPTEVTIEG